MATREYNRRYYAANRERLIADRYRHGWSQIQSWRRMGRSLLVKQEMGGRCTDCGNDNPLVLQFDHVDPATKLFNPSRAQSLTRLRQEATKCVLRCANCHSIKSYYAGDKRGQQAGRVSRHKATGTIVFQRHVE